jgi:hypothetical protein
MTPAAGNGRIWWLILIILVVGYMAGRWINQQRALKLAQWLQIGLAIWNGKSDWRIGRSIGSGTEVIVTGTDRPFRSVAIGISLLAREFLPLLAIELLRGKRDLLAMRGQLRFMPGVEWEIVPLLGKLRRLLDTSPEGKPWQWVELANGLGLATRGVPSAELVKRARAFTEQHGAYVERIALRQLDPHVLAFARLNGLERAPAAQFLRGVTDLVKE